MRSAQFNHFVELVGLGFEAEHEVLNANALHLKFVFELGVRDQRILQSSIVGLMGIRRHHRISTLLSSAMAL